MTYPNLQEGEHQIVGISVIPCDIDDEGRPIPQPNADDEPQFVCQICWQPHHEIDGPCPGPKIPSTPASLMDGD